MNVDKQTEIYNKGFKAGQEHIEPSSKTIKMIEEIKAMISNSYSNRELDGFHDRILEELTQIKTQTTATNGRLRSTEKRQATFMGGLIVLSIVVVPILVWALSELVGLSNIEYRIQNGIQQELSQYEITIQ